MYVRMAERRDAPGIRAIYGPVVAETAISFEYDVPDADEIACRIETKWPTHPWLVADRGDGHVLGYAYAGPFSGRAAYDWSVEVSLYVHPDAHRQGVGRRLYTALFAVLGLQGYAQAYAGIVRPNPASEAAHAAAGFDLVGCYGAVGWKAGAWHDVGWWQRPLRDPGTAGTPPGPIRPLDTLGPDELRAALSPTP